MAKKDDFQWLRDMPLEDYKYLTELEDGKLINIIDRIVTQQSKK